MKIAVITGHGHGDTGAVSKKWGTEANLVRKIAPRLIEQLEKYQDVQVTLLDTSINWYDELKKRYHDFTKFDYVIELHANAGAHDHVGNGHTTGLEIWVPTSEKEITVEETICKNVCKRFKIKNRGVKRCDFLVIKEIKRQGVSCCLIENGFMDDNDDMKIIKNNIQEYSKTIADAVASGFGLKKKANKSSNAKPIHVVEYLASDEKKYFLNVYANDKLEKTSFHGKYNQKLTIGTTGARNCFDTYKNGEASGKSHGTKKKGTTLLVEIIK